MIFSIKTSHIYISLEATPHFLPYLWWHIVDIVLVSLASSVVLLTWEIVDILSGLPSSPQVGRGVVHLICRLADRALVPVVLIL